VPLDSIKKVFDVLISHNNVWTSNQQQNDAILVSVEDILWLMDFVDWLAAKTDSFSTKVSGHVFKSVNFVGYTTLIVGNV